MPLVDFTSYDDIRAVLGVSDDEIEDTTLSLPLYELNLTAELEEVDLLLITDFNAQQGIDPGTWTDVQKRFDRTIRLFAAYAVAKQLTTSLPLFSPKEISDGKAGFSRYAQDPYAKTIKSVLAEYDRNRTRLLEAYAAVKSTTATALPALTFLSIASPLSDPITGT